MCGHDTDEISTWNTTVFNSFSASAVKVVSYRNMPKCYGEIIFCFKKSNSNIKRRHKLYNSKIVSLKSLFVNEINFEKDRPCATNILKRER